MSLRTDYSRFYPVSGSSLNATNEAVNGLQAGGGGGVTSVNSQTGDVVIDLPSLFPSEDLIPLIYLRDSLRFTSIQDPAFAESNTCSITPFGFNIHLNDDYDRKSASFGKDYMHYTTESIETGAESRCSFSSTGISISSKASTANGGATNSVYISNPPAPTSGSSSRTYYLNLPLAYGTLITREDAIALIEAATSPLIARIEALENPTP